MFLVKMLISRNSKDLMRHIGELLKMFNSWRDTIIIGIQVLPLPTDQRPELVHIEICNENSYTEG